MWNFIKVSKRFGVDNSFFITSSNQIRQNTLTLSYDHLVRILERFMREDRCMHSTDYDPSVTEEPGDLITSPS